MSWGARDKEGRGDAPERNAENHEDSAGALDKHHGDAQRADEAEAVGVHELGRVLEGGEQRGGDAEEGRPEQHLRAALRGVGHLQLGGEEEEGNEGDEGAGRWWLGGAAGQRGRTYMWRRTTQESVMERRHASVLTWVLMWCGGRLSCMSTSTSVYFRCGG